MDRRIRRPLALQAIDRNMIRAVIFDLDNTLIDRDAAFRLFCREYLDDAFPNLDELERTQALGHMEVRDRSRLTREDLPVVLREQNSVLLNEAESDTEIPEWLSQICSEEWDAEKRRRLPQLIEPDPAVEQLIRRLRDRFRLAIVTNGSGTVQRAKLDVMGYAHLFESIVVSGELGISKPDPLIFEAALSQLNCFPDDALFVGDDPIRDVIGAKRVGLQVAWVDGGREWLDVLDGNGNSFPERPDYTIRHVSQLEASVACLMPTS